jgi:hypothetical protein
MPTEDYEHLLELDEVVGIEHDEETDEVVVLVREKLPEDELDDDQIVSNNLDVRQSSDVIGIGQPTLEAETHREQYRPVQGSLSEGPNTSYTGGTGGPLARVSNPDSENWDDSVEADDLVRLSNNHVYAASSHTPGYFEADIVQPAQIDNGTDSDRVGSVIGYVPFDDGVRVDVAARSTEDETDTFLAFDDPPSGVQRDDYESLKGETLTKSGRTTGLTEAEVVATSATMRVQMSQDSSDTVTFSDQLVTEDMSEGGDSGSAVFGPDGQLVGLLFAGSPSATLHNKIANVEDEFGVECVTELEEDDEDDAGEEDDANEAPTEDDNPSRVLSIGPATHSGRSLAFSFTVSDDSDVEVLGGTNSTDIVGTRINGYSTSAWTNEYEITGNIVDHGIPGRARVSVDDEEIEPDELPEMFGEQ